MIGIFDSGFGGLTVMREIIKVFPETSIIYFGDSAHLPYGTKSKNSVIKFSLKILNFLLKKRVSHIVVACHTASSFALERLKKESPVPVFGMIEPAVEKVFNGNFKKVGIIGTPGTIRAKTYFNKIKEKNKKIKIFDKACPLFVPLVEEGLINHKITKDVAKFYLNSMKNKIDSLILGCTHYPLLKPVIRSIIGKKVKLIDPGEEIALYLKNNFKIKKSRRKKYHFYTTDDPEKFKILGERFLGRKIEKVYLSRCTE